MSTAKTIPVHVGNFTTEDMTVCHFLNIQHSKIYVPVSILVSKASPWTMYENKISAKVLFTVHVQQ